jgi:hypothetical protein
MERKAAARTAKGKNVGRRLERRLAKADRGIRHLSVMNNPAAGRIPTFSFQSVAANSPLKSTARSLSHMPMSYDPQTAFQNTLPLPEVSAVGVRGNMYASSLGGIGTQKAAGFVRGAMGFANVDGFTSTYAKEGAQKAVSMFDEALKAKGFLLVQQ